LSSPLPAIGRYQIAEQVGRGSMGTVYRALDPVLGRPLAIKTLNPDLPAETILEMKARFVREAQAAGRLSHPNIVTIYDVGVAGDLAYIAMEFLEGQSLRKLMKAGAIPFEQAADIVAQVAEALDYAGRFGVVHRDVKPANIMVSPAGVATLTDFGVARVPSSSLTQTGMLVGSLKYMAPEQVQEQPIDPRADIFSLGVVLYELVAGRTPFEQPESDLMALLERITKQPAEPLSAQRPDLPAGIDALLERALAKDPAQRFQRAGELAQQLRELSAPASARFATPAEPPPEPAAGQEALSKVLADLEGSSRLAAAAGAADELSLRLRKAFHYLEELVRRVIHASPPYALKLDIIYLGSLPAATLSNGTVHCAMKMIGDAEVVDRVTLTYRMSTPTRGRIALKGGEAGVLKRHLDATGLKFEARELTGRFEALVIDVDIAASAVLQADYERQSVEIVCHNIGTLGPARYSLPAAEFEDAFWEFGQLLLGMPSRFAGLRLPAGE
jgi:hypothetical protein